MRSQLFLILFAAIGLMGGTTLPAAAAPARITITSSPPGATVYVDGKERGAQGITSELFKVRLTPGGHRLLLELPGYQPLEQTVQIGRRAHRLSFTLERALARLSVRTPAASGDARDAELFIDGEPKGKVPGDVDLKEGSHLVEVRKAGFKIYTETVELRPAEVKTLMVTLIAEIRRGTLLILATGEGLVYVDGQARGTAPQGVELDAGEHAIEVRKSDSGEVLWQQRVTALAGQQVRVQADFKVADKTGTLLVVAPENAEVTVDGTQRANANQIITGLRAGQHAILVQAKGYLSVTKVIEIEQGKQRVEQVQLEKTAAGRGVAMVRVVMVNPVEGAEYFVNGRRVKEADLLGEKGMEIPAGENVVVVQQQGFGKVTRTVHVAAGGTEMVRVDLKSGGRLAVTSTPAGGQILLDGLPVGMTRASSDDVVPGPHVVEVRLDGYRLFSQQVNVQAGTVTSVQADLQPAAPPPPPPAEVSGTLVGVAPPRLMRLEMSTSLSAVTNDPGRFTVDVGGGYPYFVNAGIAVGAARRGSLGLDIGAELRSNFYVTEVGVRLRAQLFRGGPIAGGLNLFLGGGGGPDDRSDFIMELGVPITLLAGRVVQLTARPYLQLYSDRSCPTAANASSSNVTRGEACTQALDAVAMGGQDSSGALDRATSARVMLQAALEISLTRHLNLFLLIEGAPGLRRRSLTRQYNLLLLQEVDYGIYGRGGVTFKF